MTIIHNLGFPRIGSQRELKAALEGYWDGRHGMDHLLAVGKALRRHHWDLQRKAGSTWVPVGDFAWYDHILEWSALLGVVPERFGQHPAEPVSLDTVFRMARGRAPSGVPAAACEMTKWFDTNYHYIVPEIAPGQSFRVARTELFEHVADAREAGHRVKAVIPGPLTWLWLAKGAEFTDGPADPRKLELLAALVPVYVEVLKRLKDEGAEWVQVDEPILALDLPSVWKRAFAPVYRALDAAGVPTLLATYFEGLNDNIDVLADLPVHGVHLDLVRAPEQLDAVLDCLRPDQVVSAGVIDGRNIWRTDLDAVAKYLRPVATALGDRLWLAPSCSLLHVPVDLRHETALDDDVRSWLAFAVQKLEELALLAAELDGRHTADSTRAWRHQQKVVASRRQSPRIHHARVQERLRNADTVSLVRTPFAQRKKRQQQSLGLPLFPTTTIGSFPQTADIRRTRRDWRRGAISDAAYETAMREEIGKVIHFQEEVGLDVLVHGEAERNDMVEYFGELLGGFAFTNNGWVQSYGSRCVKPPIIYGDVVRPAPMTVGWTAYAQSLTDKPVKGMLTGPVTLLQWSFVRDDQPREVTCRQLALALRDEVNDLQSAGISVIQIDEPALREGLPLRRKHWSVYLRWAVDSFRLATSVAQDCTQIHTHMCYSEFNDIIESIAEMDADVITIETSRSNMQLLEAFESFEYPNDIGPGVYDIHSPNIPDAQWMMSLVRKAARRLPAERIWVNPDCGLKTRGWKETGEALKSMVSVARALRYT
ncbi:MAG TPA: 5-methyltetrahydropteroyltriglutamate--homocysteine S-methyltransferase [Burkholderiaceae bacterium]|nr:5-methyltetrahydropteroyltriglutamate--homocysteine S-methyltransferase [Burkholderiaceae bacterium]